MADERLQHEAESPWSGEHYFRYDEVQKHIQPNDRVLDIACGTGYGTHRITQYTTGEVIGGDIAAEAVETCKKTWQAPNLDFRVLDGTRLDFPDGYFDRIVSFETIEHTTAYRQMIAEFARVLKPSGTLILSTPNSAITSPDGIVPNPYHTQEFRPDELKGILQEAFPHVELYGQRYIRYKQGGKGNGAGKVLETLFLSFGIRKLPYSLRSGVMKTLFKHPLYPMGSDFALASDPAVILKECPVLFAVCKK